MGTKNAAEEAANDVDLSGLDEKAKEVSKKKAAAKKPAKAEKAEKPAKAAKAEKPASKKGPKSEGGSKSAEKEAELAKQEKADGWAFAFADVPKEVVEWPYRRGSSMLYVFQHMLKGVNKNKLRKDVVAVKSGAKEGTAYADLNEKQKERGEKSWKDLHKIMARFEHREHTWKLDEEGDTYRIHSVKYTGKQASKKDKKSKAA